MKKTDFTIQEMEVVYLPTKLTTSNETITNSASAFHMFKQLFNPNTISYQEECVVLYLNNASRIIGAQKLSKGGINATVVDIRIILATALKSLSTAIIIAHNHPSGKLEPSDADKKITKQLSMASELMDIKLLDHIIIAPDEGYFSFADDGLISK
jgi:DNA repair protein RadC